MPTERNELFESAPIGKAVLTLAIPTVLSQLITVVYNMADTFFIGQLNDPNQIAAATVCMPAFMLLTAFANLFGMGGSSFISRCLGAGETGRARHCASFCIWSGVVVAFVYGILVVLLRPLLFPILGVTEETWGYASQYALWTIGIGAVPTVMNALFAHLIRSEGYARQGGLGVALGGVLNILLDPLFIFSFGLEIRGAAIATMLSNLAATCFFVIFLYRIRKKTVITGLPAEFTLRYHIPAQVLSVGLPGFLLTMMSTISNTALNRIIAGYSSEAIAGMGIAKKIDLLAYAISQGMTQGTLPLIGYNYASGDHKRCRSAIRTALFYSVLVAFAGMILLLFLAGPVVRAFIADTQTVGYGRSFLRIICLACPTTAVNFMVITVFQAIGKHTEPLVLSLLRKGTLDVLFMLLFNHFFGIMGVPWATPVADGIAFVISIILILPYLGALGKKKA